jgi:hypothetical protein
MMSFPSEPAERKVAIDARYRNPSIILRFLEGYHRGENLFGPYGSIWLSKLQADRRLGRLARHDLPYFEALQERYPDLLQDSSTPR